MKKFMFSSLLLIAGLFITSCGDDDSDHIEEKFQTPASIQAELVKPSPDLALMKEHGVDVCEETLFGVGDLQPIGTSYVVRLPDIVLAVVKTKGLQANTATTLWWVVFNEPEKCVDGCNVDDLFMPETRADMLFADGKIIESNGETVFIGSRKTKDLSTSLASVLWGGKQVGIADAYKSEIHLVLRSHGEIIPGMENEMTTTFNGGCGGFPPEAGIPGPNMCEDIQFSVHLADSCEE